jgi:hypothetical protein
MMYPPFIFTWDIEKREMIFFLNMKLPPLASEDFQIFIFYTVVSKLGVCNN